MDSLMILQAWLTLYFWIYLNLGSPFLQLQKCWDMMAHCALSLLVSSKYNEHVKHYGPASQVVFHFLLSVPFYIFLSSLSLCAWIRLIEYPCKFFPVYKDIRTFEVLLRTYEVREERMQSLSEDGDGSNGSVHRKRRQCSDGSYVLSGSPSISSVMARPCGEARGHTGYLTFARVKCVSWRVLSCSSQFCISFRIEPHA